MTLPNKDIERVGRPTIDQALEVWAGLTCQFRWRRLPTLLYHVGSGRGYFRRPADLIGPLFQVRCLHEILHQLSEEKVETLRMMKEFSTRNLSSFSDQEKLTRDIMSAILGIVLIAHTYNFDSGDVLSNIIAPSLLTAGAYVIFIAIIRIAKIMALALDDTITIALAHRITVAPRDELIS